MARVIIGTLGLVRLEWLVHRLLKKIYLASKRQPHDGFKKRDEFGNKANESGIGQTSSGIRPNEFGNKTNEFGNKAKRVRE